MRWFACRPDTASFVCFLIALIGALCSTLLHDYLALQLKAGILSYAILDSPDAGSYSAFLDSTDPNAGAVLSTYYLYNVTNAEAVVNAGARPHVVEIGPLRYNYRVTRHNVNWQNGDEEIVYNEYQRYVAMDDATRALELVPITNVHVLLLAALRSKQADFIPALFPWTKDPRAAFVTRPARDWLWGYVEERFDGLVPAFPGLQGNDTSLEAALLQHSPTRMATGSKRTEVAYDYLEFDGGVELFCCPNGVRGEAGAGLPCEPLWSGYDASVVRGSYGNNFHPFVEPTETLWLATYPFGIYRAWPLQCSASGGSGPGWLYEGSSLSASIGSCNSYDHEGISLLRFTVPSYVLGNASVSIVEARAYNITGASGIIDVSACESDAPIVLSFPRFLQGSDSLRNAIDGLGSPTFEDHGSWVGVDPITGGVLDLVFRVGINGRIAPITADPFGKPYTYFGSIPETVFPLGWGEQVSGATPAQAVAFVQSVYTPLRGLAAARWGGASLGVVALLAGVVCHVRARRRVPARSRDDEDDASSYEPLSLQRTPQRRQRVGLLDNEVI